MVPFINQGATIYIGEEGLNLTRALNAAGGLSGPDLDSTTPTNTSVGWWAGYVTVTEPSRMLNIGTRYQNLSVVSGDFVGYTGYWYLVNPTTRRAITGPDGRPRMVFRLADPSLNIQIIDIDRDIDATGRSALLGDSLAFRIETNMYEALDGGFRTPVTDSGNDGYIDIRVRNETSYSYTGLADSSGTPRSLLRLNVNTTPWTWGDPSNPAVPSAWDTGITDSSGQPLYTAGTYTVIAESLLNNMKATYRQGGADYTGKTVSQTTTVTLVHDYMQLQTNRVSVNRGERFSMILTGRPKSAYYFWVNDTGAMSGMAGDQPPTILVSAPVLQDPYEGPYAIGAHPIRGAGGKTILEDIPVGAWGLPRNMYYAKIVMSYSGVAILEVRTSPDTRPGTYTFRAEDDGSSDEVTVLVRTTILPPDEYPPAPENTIDRPLINPDGSASTNTGPKYINSGATIFIGEEGLDITEALASADAAAFPALQAGGSDVGWWGPYWDVRSNPPWKAVRLAGRETRFSVAPADFVGYWGTWYLVDPLTGLAARDGTGSPIPVFTIADPSLDIRVWDLATNTDVRDRSVPQGSRLAFRIDTNMYPAFDMRYRTDVDENTLGTINIVLKNMNGARYTYLYSNNTTPISLGNIRVENQPWFWGDGTNPFIPSSNGFWNTRLLDRDGYFFYPAGTYTVGAESTLNAMKDRYKSGGADYTGKTVSQFYTVTLTPLVSRPSDFNVSRILVSPSQEIVSGSPVTVSFMVNITGNSMETFPSGNELGMSSDLENARWNYTIILNDVESPQPATGGQTLFLSGWILSYPPDVQESVLVTLDGTAPVVLSPASMILVNVTEFDNHANPDLYSRFSRSVVIVPYAPATLPTPTPVTSPVEDSFPSTTNSPATTGEGTPASTTVTVNIGGDSGALRAVVTGTKISDLIVTGTVEHDGGNNDGAPPGIVFRYIRIEPARYESISHAAIDFSVPQSWLDANHIRPESIVMYHQTADGWGALPTTFLYEKDGMVFFSASSPGFSLFAIAGTPAGTIPATAATTQGIINSVEPTPEPAAGVAKTPLTTQTTVPQMPAAKPDAPSPLLNLALIIAAIGVLTGGGFMVRRWWIRRQNPALFEES